MKKLFTLIVAALTFASSAMALENVPEEGLSFQALFGMNVSNLTNTDMNAKVGMNIGVKAEYMLPNCYGTFVNLGVLYTMKGARKSYNTTIGTEDVEATNVLRPCYLEIPLHVGYRYNILENWGVYADFGPYFALGINGKNRIKFDNYAEDVTHQFFKHNKIQRFDCGLGFRIGTEYANQHSLTLGMDWGLTDMYKDEFHRNNPGLIEMKNFNASLTYGYRF